mmetsp:Transcript_107254/g.207820  ORF Transcript_107254/g.207820 Transcript_107254/m.207820 type:complete len:88 (+) Transcript_107254:51-314(+)
MDSGTVGVSAANAKASAYDVRNKLLDSQQASSGPLVNSYVCLTAICGLLRCVVSSDTLLLRMHKLARVLVLAPAFGLPVAAHHVPFL